MPSLDTLHNELRLVAPNKPSEFYNDALRWAMDVICRKTSMWEVVTKITTKPGVSVYDIDLAINSAIHSNLYIIQKGATDRAVKRPVNGFKVNTLGNSDYLKAFRTVGIDQIEIAPTPKEGGVVLEVHTSIKPTSYATIVDNDKLFDEYKDTVVYGALFRCMESSDLEKAIYYETKFKHGYSAIHSDVIKENADTPLKMRAGW